MGGNHSRSRRRRGFGHLLTVRHTAVVGFLLVAAVAVQGCAVTQMGGGMGASGVAPMGGMHGGSSGNRENAPPPSTNAVEALVVAGDIWFQPDELRIAAGETVNVTLDNQGAALHDFTISDLDFVLVAAGGETSSGALTIDAPGRYDFICSVPGHAQAGMTGTLIVE